MQPETHGRFRVHNRQPGEDDGETTAILVELPDRPAVSETGENTATYEPIHAVITEQSDENTPERPTETVRPGHVIDATVTWDESSAYITESAVHRRSRFQFADGVSGLFEAATSLWDKTRTAGDHMGSTATRSTDGEPNGALYVFADPPGRDLYTELREGHIPVEPLITRVNARRGASERAVFVLHPTEGDFVVVYVVFDVNGVLAQTVRDTYELDGGLAERAARPADSETSDGSDPATLADLDIDLDGQ